MKDYTMTEILGYEFRNFGNKESTLLLASDVAELFEYNDVVAMLGLIKDYRKEVLETHDGKELWFIAESGLYELIMQTDTSFSVMLRENLFYILKPFLRAATLPGEEEEFIKEAFPYISEKALFTLVQELTSNVEEVNYEIS